MQGGSGRGGSENQQAQQPPQKCPRCESLNTKFCYYNNYSLSQPRYFCKTCRRYWTQGGTLRNVPVGGGCRKGKRTNKISSATVELSSRSSQPRQPNSVSSSNPVSKRTEKPVSSAPSPASCIAAPMGSYFSSGGGGFLSSLASVQTQSLNPSQQLHQALSTSNNIGGPSNLGLLQGFSAVVPSPIGSSSSSQQIEQSKIIYQIGNIREKSAVNPLYYDQNSSEHHYQESSIQSMRSGCGNPSQHEAWLHQAFLNTDNDSNNNPNVPADDHDTALWRATSTTNSNANTNTNPAGSVSASFNPNHEWPGYGPPL